MHEGVGAESVQERILNDGSRWEVLKRYFEPGQLAQELGGGRVLHADDWFVAVASPDAAPLVVPLDRLAPARQPRLPRLRRGRLPARVAADRAAVQGPACLHLRPGTRLDGRRGAPAVARPSGPNPAPLARNGGGAVLRDLLLRVGHALLPGRAANGKGDRTPTPREQELCSFWREWELRLLRPRLIVPVGGLAVRHLLGRSNLTECIGQTFELDAATAIPLPHPSGVSLWLNDPAHRNLVERGVELIHASLALEREPGTR